MSDAWFEAQGGNGAVLDVPKLFDGPAADAVWEVVAAGALVSVGLSSDGGALAVTVTADGRWRREWFRDPETMVEWLTGAREAVESVYRTRESASSGRRSRGRSRP